MYKMKHLQQGGKMGSRGAMSASGKLKRQEWKSVGKMNGIKILEKINAKENRGLPWYCVKPNTAYILLDEEGNFLQLRQYGEDRSPKFDVDFDIHTPLGDEKIPHIHEFINGKRQTGRLLTKDEHDKYKKFFEGGK